MGRLADGDRAAFEPLFRALWPRGLAAARRVLDEGAAADAAQSTMMKVFAHAPSFRRGSPLLPWFWAIAANEIRATRRGQRGHTTLDDGAAGSVPGPDDPERVALDRELRDALAHAMDELDAESAEAIAAVLGLRERPAIAAAAFRKRVSRAYAKLRILLGGHGER